MRADSASTIMNANPEPAPSLPAPRLTPLKRFLWTCLAVGGGLGIVAKFLDIAARHQKWYDDFFGQMNRLPWAVQIAITWQRFVADNILYFAVLVLLPLTIWIWCSRRPATVRLVVLILVSALFAQGLASILVTLSYMPFVLRQLSGP